MGNTVPSEVVLEHYKALRERFTSQGDRLWLRFYYFLTIEAALCGTTIEEIRMFQNSEMWSYNFRGYMPLTIRSCLVSILELQITSRCTGHANCVRRSGTGMMTANKRVNPAAGTRPSR